MGSASPNPHAAETTPFAPVLGGEAEPTRPAWEGNNQLPPAGRPVGQRDAAPPEAPAVSARRRELGDGRTEPIDPHAFRPIMSPELRAAFMAAHYAWAKKTAPWLLEEWLA